MQVAIFGLVMMKRWADFITLQESIYQRSPYGVDAMEETHRSMIVELKKKENET